MADEQLMQPSVEILNQDKSPTKTMRDSEQPELPVVSIPRGTLKKKYTVKMSTGQVARMPEVPTLRPPSSHATTTTIATAVTTPSQYVPPRVAWVSTDQRPRVHYTSADNQDRWSQRRPEADRYEQSARAESRYHGRDTSHNVRHESSGRRSTQGDREHGWSGHRYDRFGRSTHSDGDQLEQAVAVLRRVFGRDEAPGFHRR